MQYWKVTCKILAKEEANDSAIAYSWLSNWLAFAPASFPPRPPPLSTRLTSAEGVNGSIGCIIGRGGRGVRSVRSNVYVEKCMKNVCTKCMCNTRFSQVVCNMRSSNVRVLGPSLCLSHIMRVRVCACVCMCVCAFDHKNHCRPHVLRSSVSCGIFPMRQYHEYLSDHDHCRAHFEIVKSSLLDFIVQT